MKNHLKPVAASFLAFSLVSSILFAEPRRQPGDTLSKGTFILHKFQQAIGKESYFIVQDYDTARLFSDFKFTDRGSPVPLTTQYSYLLSGKPAYFSIKGKTSRSSVIDTEVRIRKDSAVMRVNSGRRTVHVSEPSFPISGYAPVSIQMMMLKYWNAAGKPATLKTLPAGEVTIQWKGSDTIDVNGKKQVAERYFVKGLIWGKEWIWTDRQGNLIILFTNDAEGDKFEAVREGYEASLPYFIGKAASYGMMDMADATPGTRQVLALTGGTIVDVVTGSTSSGTVIIQDGVVAGIGKSEKIPGNAKVIDVTGKFLCPGLWDMHAHFQQVEWGPAYLAAGVTTVRDCGNEFDFINSVKRAIDTGKGVGPRILKAGIVDGDSPYALGIVRVNNPDDAKRVVKMYKDNDYAQIKIYSSMTKENVKAVADEAHAVGLTVTGHVPRGLKVTETIELGQDQINHFTSLLSALRTSNERPINLSDSLPNAVLASLVSHHTVVDPTLAIYEWVTRSLDQPVDAFEPGVNYLTEDLKEIFRNTGMPPDQAAKSTLLKTGKEIVLKMHQLGIPIVAGTDMMVPGFSLCREVELYQEAGLTPLAALQTATIVPARVMKRDDRSGSIEKGKQADIIVLGANPLENVSALRSLKWVIKDGVVYNPSELRKLVDFKP